MAGGADGHPGIQIKPASNTAASSESAIPVLLPGVS
jgi:hypothetical protein